MKANQRNTSQTKQPHKTTKTKQQHEINYIKTENKNKPNKQKPNKTITHLDNNTTATRHNLQKQINTDQTTKGNQIQQPHKPANNKTTTRHK